MIGTSIASHWSIFGDSPIIFDDSRHAEIEIAMHLLPNEIAVQDQYLQALVGEIALDPFGDAALAGPRQTGEPANQCVFGPCFWLHKRAS